MTTTLILIIIAFFLVCFVVLYFFKWLPQVRQKKRLDNQIVLLEKELSELKNTSMIQVTEREAFEAEKSKVQEKNRKIWQMSETVYKEKKKVDEQLELVRTEKEKLEVEKAKVDDKVKKLWTQSMAIHKEKEKINEIKEEIEIKHREVIDSVNYAKRIQDALLPSLRQIEQHFSHSFVLFKPRNIVSGDFYWFSQKEGKLIIASVDCTGHGVPGAFMSLIGNTLLNHIVNEKSITDPAEILNQLNKEVNKLLHQTESGSESKDGMDVAICVFEEQYAQKEVVAIAYAGANRPLFYIENNELQEIKADKFPIGGLDYDNLKKFTTQIIQLRVNTSIYIFSDGFADQFGSNNKKLKTKKFKEILLSIQDKPMEQQKSYLGHFIDDWKGATEQTDDILVIGIKL